MTSSPAKPHTDRALLVLLGSVGITLLLYLVPQLELVAYPLRYLSTMVHEMGHGFAAILVGGEFIEFKMWSDGSGVAPVAIPVSEFRSAVVSAGGLVGPAIAAAIGFACARRPRPARIALGVVGGVLLLAELLWVRTGFGLLFVGAVAACCLGLALWTTAQLSQVGLVFLSSQLALSVYSRGDYLFTDTAHTGAGTFPSDTANMASALGGPYWLWGGLCALMSVAALALGVWLMLRGKRSAESSRVPAKSDRPAGLKPGLGPQ